MREITKVNYDKAVVEIFTKKMILLDENGDPVKDKWGEIIRVPISPDDMYSKLVLFNNSVDIVPFNKDKETE